MRGLSAIAQPVILFKKSENHIEVTIVITVSIEVIRILTKAGIKDQC